jgi:uncharacterized membrane protein YcaP (DUF421 family)
LDAWLFGIDWRALFVPQASPIEIVLRGTVIYLGLFALLRLLLRGAGTVGVADLLVVVLMADASQNALSPSEMALPDGLLLVGTIGAWAFALNWLGYHFPRLEYLIYPAPLPLVRDGRMLRRNMRRELITEEELMSQIRLQGLAGLEDVKEAFMEGDGRISVVGREGRAGGARKRTI